jgi:hypothetical protein
MLVPLLQKNLLKEEQYFRSLNQRRTYQREMYKSADKRNDLGKVQTRSFYKNIINYRHLIE